MNKETEFDSVGLGPAQFNFQQKFKALRADKFWIRNNKYSQTKLKSQAQDWTRGLERSDNSSTEIGSPCDPKGPDLENAGTCKEPETNTDCLEEEEAAGVGIEPVILVSKALAETRVGEAVVEGVHALAAVEAGDHGDLATDAVAAVRKV